MESSTAALLFTFFFALLPSLTVSGIIYNSSIPINFTASYLQFIDNSGAGAFLASPNKAFQARITNSKPESRSFYFVIVHVLSNTIIWSANRNQPISQSSQLRLTSNGLTLYNDALNPIWSTPENRSSVSSMKLLESGNLILLDAMNNTLWESFNFPTDILVLGQKLRLGKSLVSSNKEDLSEGGYKLVIGDGDAMLQWNGMNYWKLSMEVNAFRDSNIPVQYMVLNKTGVCLIGGNNDRVVMSVAVNDFNGVPFTSSDFQMVKLDDRGVLSVFNYNRNDRTMKQAFTGPADVCKIPYICRKLGVCVNGGSCACAPAFHSDPKVSNGDCAPTDTSLVLPGPCNGSSSTSVKYLNLRNNLDYFSNEFTDPVMRGANLTWCQSLCSMNCSCLGVFYSESSGSCYMVRNYLGSVLVNSGSTDRTGYVKAIALSSPIGYEEKHENDFPVIAVVLLPLSGVLLITIIAVVILIRRKKRMWKRRTDSKLGRGNSSSEGEIEFVSIPGLPVRIDYQDLADATDGFKTQIGSGGFGTVYKGTLKDGSEVAVKKITCMGARGNTEFLTEIAVIGKIHHVNLVRLKGFCAHRGQRLLVYEFMKRGSLDRTLFGGEPVLEWRERYEIALGTARGLAYLHSGCEHKIIHCDVKPENILLHDTSQVKISDFGLSKLLSPEESGLFTTMRGTRGYLAPEWLTSSAISDKTDVYSYGMVLLEIIRGKKNSSPQMQSNNNNNNSLGTDEGEGRVSGNTLSSPSSGESGHRFVYFPLFALEMHENGRYAEVVDPRLMGRVRRNEVEKLVRVALCCVHEEPNLRPSMSNVVGMLEGAVPLGEPRVESLNFLRFYGRRFTEESTVEENGVAMLYRQAMNNANGTSSSSYDSLSYMSSQQVSGPR